LNEFHRNIERRLRDETDMVEKEIESHKQQPEALNKRLEGLKRAANYSNQSRGRFQNCFRPAQLMAALSLGR
jgi:hypothetical protein